MTTTLEPATELPAPPAPPAPPPGPPRRWDLPARRAASGPRPPRATRPGTPARGVAAWTFAALSLLLLWLVFYALVLSSFQHSHDQSVLYAQFREKLALETAPLGGQITPGAAVAVLRIPSIGVSEVVVEGTAAEDLMNGPGHRRDTPLPGQAGISIVYGRSTLFGGPFGGLARVHPGAVIKVVTQEGTSRYVVADVRHAGDPYPPQLAAGGGRLTLATAESSGWRSGWAPSRTVYVDATLQGTAYATPAGRPAAVPRAETAMQGDRGSLVVLVLWIPVLLLGAVGAVWAAVRWGRMQAWLVGFPVVLAGLWGVSQSAIALLPNLM